MLKAMQSVHTLYILIETVVTVNHLPVHLHIQYMYIRTIYVHPTVLRNDMCIDIIYTVHVLYILYMWTICLSF